MFFCYNFSHVIAKIVLDLLDLGLNRPLGLRQMRDL